MTTKYNLGDFVFFIHDGKIKTGRIVRLELRAFAADYDGRGLGDEDEIEYAETMGATELYGVQFDLNEPSQEIKEFQSGQLFTSREALIASL